LSKTPAFARFADLEKEDRGGEERLEVRRREGGRQERLEVKEGQARD
jgi:hypothetical protein